MLKTGPTPPKQSLVQPCKRRRSWTDPSEQARWCQDPSRRFLEGTVQNLLLIEPEVEVRPTHAKQAPENVALGGAWAAVVAFGGSPSCWVRRDDQPVDIRRPCRWWLRTVLACSGWMDRESRACFLEHGLVPVRFAARGPPGASPAFDMHCLDGWLGCSPSGWAVGIRKTSV